MPSKAKKTAKRPTRAGAKEKLLLVLGSGPSMAMLESMLSAAAANGVMYHNAVTQQQRADIVGMISNAQAIEIMLAPKKKR